MKRFYKISESFVQKLLQSATLKCQKWPLSSCFPRLTQISTQHYAPKYNVFLNFRGRDTRQTFVHNLYEALRSKGIAAFRDDKSVNKGDLIRRELFRAIEECRIAIVILSENYAASEWCLEELVKIMKCKKRLTIFPVFYDVCPSEVRNLRGSFGGAFAEHEKNYEDKPSKVKIWKKALSKAAGISGFDLSNYNGDEKKCIQDITEEVCKKLEAIKREKYEGRKTVAECKQNPKLTHGKQKMVKSQSRRGWRRAKKSRVVCMHCVERETTNATPPVVAKLGRTMMVARAEESPGRTAAGRWRGLPIEVCQGKTIPQLGQTAVASQITISSMYSCDKKVESPTADASTSRLDSLWSFGMYFVGTKLCWNWIGMGVGFSLTIHTKVLRVVVYMHFVPCQQTIAKGKGKDMVVVRLYLLAFCCLSTRKQPGDWMVALVRGELRNIAFVLVTLILTIIVCQGMATKTKPHLLLRGSTFTILRVFVYSVPCQQIRQILLWTMVQNDVTEKKRHSFRVIELAQTEAAAGWASPPYYPHQSLQTIEPYIRERKASYSLDVG